MNLELITDEKEFYSLQDQWDELLQRSRSDNIFLTFDWMRAWWKHFKEEKELAIVVSKENNKIIGIAPFVIEGQFVKKLKFLGSYKADYSDFIITNKREECLDLIFQYVYKNLEWDVVELSGFRSDSPNLSYLLGRESKLNHLQKIKTYSVSPYLSLDTDWGDYQGKIRKKLIRDTNRQIRRLRELGGLAFERCEKKELSNLMEEFVQQKSFRYRSTGARNIFNDEEVINFYKDVVGKFHKKGWLDLSYLKLNNEYIAIHFGFIYKNRFYYYMSSFNVKYGKFSAERLLLFYILQNIFTNDFEEFDFLVGDDKYKFDWTRHQREMYHLSVYRKNLKGYSLYIYAEKVLPRLKESKLVRRILNLYRKLG